MLAAGALGWWALQIRICQESGEQRLIHRATGSPGAVAIKALLQVFGDPFVHQRTGGAGVETDHRIALQHAEVGNAAQVQHSACFAGVGKQGLVESGRQRCAFAAQRQILAPKVGHHRDSGTGRNDVGVADLQADAAIWRMPDVLAVAADDLYLAGLQAGRCDQRLRRRGKDLGDRVVQFAVGDQRQLSLAGQGQQLCAQGLRIVIGLVRQQLDAVAINRDQRRINAVNAGSGNQAETVTFGHRRGTLCSEAVLFQRRHLGVRQHIQLRQQRFGFRAEAGQFAARYRFGARQRH